MPTQPKPVYIDTPDNVEPDTTPTFNKFPVEFHPTFLTGNLWDAYGDSDGETFTQPSLTIPNEAYTIRELLDKHTRGVMPNVSEQGMFWEDDPDFDSPDLQKLHQMDLYDVQEHLTKTKTLIEQLDKNYKSQQDQARQQQDQKGESEAKANKVEGGTEQK